MATAWTMATASALLMTRPEVTRRRPLSRSRALRLGLTAAGGVALAGLSFGNAMGSMFAQRNPRLALRFDPFNATALAGAATLSLADYVAAKKNADDGAALAATSLRRGPVSAASMRAVAIATSLKAEAPRSLRQFRIAEAMSRRDLPTQMALIETCVARGDVGCALVHYDIALTNSAGNAAPLFPVLSGALVDPVIVRAIAPYLRQARPWGASFMAYAAQQAEPRAAAALLIATGRLPDGQVNRESEGVVFGRLQAAGAWDLVRAMHRAVDKVSASSAVLGFTSATIDPHRIPVAWRPISSGSVAATFEPAGGDAYALRLDVAGDAAGEVEAGQRILFLPPGPQAMSVRLGETTSGVTLTLKLRCLDLGDTAGREIAVWHPATTARGTYLWRFATPAACATQALSVSVKGAVDQSQGIVTVEQISLAHNAS